MKQLKHLFDRNLAWANAMKEEDPEFFSRSSKRQAPRYLWIGCSDSRVPANQIVDLPPATFSFIATSRIWSFMRT
jgi:carbonic anhydrase